MAGVRGTPVSSGKYIGWYKDRHDRQRFFTGTRRKKQTLEMAQRLEDQEREIKLGYKSAPSAAQAAADRPFGEVLQEYLDWGDSHGGRGGRPWASEHSRKRRCDLQWWHKVLEIEIIAELDGVLPRVEEVLRAIQREGAKGKTLHNKRGALLAFIHWMIDHGYLDNNPIGKSRGFDINPVNKRRMLRAEELQAFFASCRPKWKLLYQTAVCTGLRKNELKSLKVMHLDMERKGLHLEAAWTKNRRPGFQPLPQGLFDSLVEASQGKGPEDPLLRVPKNAVEVIERDFTLAGIPKKTPEGKLDFHSLRTAYVNLVISAGASVKEAQDLARHLTPDMTMNVYGRSDDQRKVELTEIVGKLVFEPVKK